DLLAHDRAVVRFERLVIAVDAFLHHLAQPAGGVAGEQGIPIRPPDHLDHVPAGAAEARLQLLDDLAVATHRAVEPLQVAIDDEDQVVELLAARHGDGAERFGLVGLAVASEAPDFAPVRLRETAVPQAAEELALISRAAVP